MHRARLIPIYPDPDERRPTATPHARAIRPASWLRFARFEKLIIRAQKQSPDAPPAPGPACKISRSAARERLPTPLRPTTKNQ
jgi:hypothetical protein